MDLTHVDAYFERTRRTLVGLVIASADPDQPLFLATGVLVLLGGREFILTAGHNVWNAVSRKREVIAVGTPSDVLSSLIHPGNGTAGAVYHHPASPGEDPEPDVAVVEPTDKAVLLPQAARQPFTEDEIIFFDPKSADQVTENQVRGRELIAAGYPARFAIYEQPAMKGTRGALTIGMAPMRVTSIPSFVPNRPRFSREPSGGRGFHVYFSKQMEDQNDQVTRLDSLGGLSGGPVVSPARAGMLVGIMRGAMDFEDGWDEWCEPAAEAVRLLLDHEAPNVREAAARVWERYEADRLASG